MKPSLKPISNRPLKLYPPQWVIEVVAWLITFGIVYGGWRVSAWLVGADR